MAHDTTVVWQDIEVSVPSSWELVRYGLHYERGVCTFSDELEERLQLSWQRDIGQPDFERLLSDLKSKEHVEDSDDAEQHRVPEFSPLPGPEAWHGVVITRQDGIVTRAARHFGPHKTLVEATVLWQTGRDAETETGVLSSIRVAGKTEWSKWQAFGIWAEVPRAMRLVSCQCLPGKTQWSFQGKKTFPTVAISRVGFASVWLKEPLRDWLQKQVPERSRVLRRVTKQTGAGHSMEQITSTRSRGHLGFLVGAKITRNDYACLCPGEERVYHVVIETTGGTPDLVRLRCRCGDLLIPAGMAP